MLENLWVCRQICYKQEIAREKSVNFEFLIKEVEGIPAIWDAGNLMHCTSDLVQTCKLPEMTKVLQLDESTAR